MSDQTESERELRSVLRRLLADSAQAVGQPIEKYKHRYAELAQSCEQTADKIKRVLGKEEK